MAKQLWLELESVLRGKSLTWQNEIGQLWSAVVTAHPYREREFHSPSSCHANDDTQWIERHPQGRIQGKNNNRNKQMDRTKQTNKQKIKIKFFFFSLSINKLDGTNVARLLNIYVLVEEITKGCFWRDRFLLLLFCCLLFLQRTLLFLLWFFLQRTFFLFFFCRELYCCGFLFCSATMRILHVFVAWGWSWILILTLTLNSQKCFLVGVGGGGYMLLDCQESANTEG